VDGIATHAQGKAYSFCHARPHPIDRSQPHEGSDDVHRLLRREPGTGPGASLVDFLNERLYGGGAALGVCMAAVSLSSAPIAIILIIVSGARQA
jgi:hypothetical protein